MAPGGEAEQPRPLPSLSWQVLSLLRHSLQTATATCLPGVPASTPSHCRLPSVRLMPLNTEPSTSCGHLTILGRLGLLRDARTALWPALGHLPQSTRHKVPVTLKIIPSLDAALDTQNFRLPLVPNSPSPFKTCSNVLPSRKMSPSPS